MSIQSRFQQVTAGIFFGNYFYGLCAVALSVETSLQQKQPLSPFSYYIVIFLLTVLYYTKAYTVSGSAKSANPRTQWYIRYRRQVQYTQWIFLLACTAACLWFLFNYAAALWKLPVNVQVLLLLFPLVAIMYYGIDSNVFPGYNLRRVGWLKPFFIGWVWAGLVTVYPLVFSAIVHRQPITVSGFNSLLFIQNFMFIAVISIMFDIKDYAADSNRQLKTFVVRNGLRRTIFSLLIPLSVAGWAIFIVFALKNDRSTGGLIVNSIPFLLLILMAASLSRRKSILFYLVVIDGLMLAKAACGIVAALFIK